MERGARGLSSSVTYGGLCATAMGNTTATDPIALTVEWIAAAMAGVIVAGDRRRAFTGVSIDTRTLKAGDLFVAVRGDRFDGADFAPAAIEAGAAGVVTPPGRAVAAGDAVIIEVDDTIAALQAL